MASCLCSNEDCDKSAPLNYGTGYLSEKSPAFYKNPREWFQRHLNKERVFVCRFAMKPCFIISSNALVKELLNKNGDETYNGLQDFFMGLFGNNIMFCDNSQQLREILLPLMQTETIKNYQEILK